MPLWKTLVFVGTGSFPKGGDLRRLVWRRCAEGRERCAGFPRRCAEWWGILPRRRGERREGLKFGTGKGSVVLCVLCAFAVIHSW